MADGITLPAALSIYGLVLRYRWRDAQKEDAQKEKETARENA